MNSRKYHYALWMIASFWLAIMASMWVGQNLKEQKKLEDHKVIEEAFNSAYENPEEYLPDYFDLILGDKYSKYAYANAMGLILADAHSQERSAVIYIQAMHTMDEKNIKSFFFQTYDRLMENDREKYENTDSEFPEEVQKNIEKMFSDRPIFEFSQKETIAIIECVQYAKSELKRLRDSSFIGRIFTFEKSQGCSSLMRMHNNINLQ